MSLHVRKLKADVAFASVVAINAIKRDLATALAKSHADITSKPAGGDYTAPSAQSPLLVAAANGDGTLATLRVLALDLYNVYLAHLADDLAHKLADPAPALVKPTSADALATIQTFLNALKADYNTHIASTTYHYAADAANGIAAVDATNQATADTLANEIKADLNLHMALAPTSPSIKLVGV